MKTLLRDTTVLPGGDDWTPRRGVDILIDGGLIGALGERLAAPDGAVIISASSLLVIPAFINAHTHSPEMLGRGLMPTATQPEWLAKAYGDGRDTLSDADIRRAIRLCAADVVRGGAVAVTDHFRQVPARFEAVAAAAHAWAESGVAARIAVNLRDRVASNGGLVGVPNSTTVAAPTKTVLRLVEELLTANLPVPIGPGPSAPHRVTDELLIGAFALSRARNSFMHMHVCESVEDAATCRALYGRSAITHLERLGVLAENVEIAHAVQVDDDDLAIIATRGTRIIHNPVANLRLGAGIAPIASALERGITVLLGTDGAGSNDTQSMLEAAKFALLLPRAAKPVPAWLSPGQVLRMATGGVVIAPGAPANLVAFDTEASAFVGPMEDWLACVVLAAREHDIVHVIGGGVFLMRDRKLCLP
jgi:5-methylthioadenosine/S-adenosylhomocysteine deaminase